MMTPSGPMLRSVANFFSVSVISANEVHSDRSAYRRYCSAPVKWLCGSMSPGSTAAPPRSTSSAPSARRRASSKVPT